MLMNEAFNKAEFDAMMFHLMFETLSPMIVRGAFLEVELFKSAIGFKQTTAEEIAARLEIDLPPGVELTLPDWLIEASREILTETFQEDYWQRINQTTRADIEHTLETGIAEGWSVRRIANHVLDIRGPDYARHRANNVARTETGNMMNAGHNASINQLNDELDFDIGKEWLSVLGLTTRDTHASKDGEIRRADEGFELGGVVVPWPSHHSLPARERCNCQCTLISAILVEGLDEVTPVDGEDGAAEEQEESKEPKSLFARIAQNKALDDITTKTIGETFEREKRDEWEKLKGDYLEGMKQTTAKLRESSGLTPEVRGMIADNEKRKARLAELIEETRDEQDRNAKRFAGLINVKQSDRIRYDTRFMSDGPKQRGVNKKVNKTVQERARRAEDFVSSISHRSVYGQDKVVTQWHQLKKGSRAYHRGSVSTWADPIDSTGMYVTDRHGITTYVHELAHSIEARNPKVKQLTNEFVQQRVARAGTPDEKLRTAYPSHGYRSDEVGNKDSFDKLWDDPDDSSKHYAGKTYESGHTEILALGVEQLYDDPAKFARDDPEYFKFVVGILNGEL